MYSKSLGEKVTEVQIMNQIVNNVLNKFLW